MFCIGKTKVHMKLQFLLYVSLQRQQISFGLISLHLFLRNLYGNEKEKDHNENGNRNYILCDYFSYDKRITTLLYH